MKKAEFQTRRLEAPKVRADDGTLHLSGIIPYNSLSEDLGGFREEIAPGAFTKTLRERDVVCLRNHDSTQVMGRMSAGTFSVQDTEAGLTFDVSLPDTEAARELYTSVERGDAPGVSFGFFVVQDSVKDGFDCKIRTLLEVALLEISVGVTFPAYPESSSFVKQRDLLSAHGIDMQSVCDALTDDNYSEERSESIRSTIKALQALVPSGQPDDESTANDKPDDESTLNCWLARQREIDLICIENRR